MVKVVWPGEAGGRFHLYGTPAIAQVLEREAPWWNYALLNRERWRGTDFLNVAQESRALDIWEGLFGREALPSGDAVAPLMEVAIRSAGERDNWACRVMPWEFLLQAVIRSRHPREGSDRRRVPVLRRWVHPGVERNAATLPSDAAGWRVLVVLSAPGFIGGHYQLGCERDMILRRFHPAQAGQAGEHLDPPGLRTLWTPTFAQLREAIETFRPHIVHLAGCDTHQAMALAEQPGLTAPGREERLRQLGLLDAATGDAGAAPGELDGFAMLDEASAAMHGQRARIRCVPFTDLPALFERHAPALVCWNLYNSGNRIAALTVGEGRVGASVGFQDYIDDGVAEEYFDEFYRGLLASGGAVGAAHVRGLQAVWRLPMKLGGAGIVCWTGPSRAGDVPAATEHERGAPSHPTPLHEPASGPLDTGAAIGSFAADIRVPPGLNYAQLHQTRHSAFDRFRLHLDKPHVLRGVDIEVRLNGEDRELAYRARVDLQPPFLDLRERIQFPLTAPLARSCRESVVTTLYVRLTHGEHVLHCDTYATRLLPADQWRFEEGSAHTLASFVFPRDPSVEQLVLAAQKYVRVLRDDAMAGFEGYQAADTGAVDLQVRALWSALLHEWRLGYINPPPAYSRELDSQRLRTPAMVLEGGWGTCVDLALLLAAALELVDIHPTLFVLKAHAFAGYWRSADARERFLKVSESVDSWEAGHFQTRRPVHGMFLSSSLEEIRSYVDNGELVVLEATLLTTGGSFEAAMSEGLLNLDEPEEFDYMIDLMSARAAQVTPLPLQPA